MPGEQWLPKEDVVDVPGVPRTLRLGRPVEVPLEELAFVTEEDLPAVLDPDALNCGNLVDIYQEREADFKNLSRLEVSYVDSAGEQARETLFVLDVEMQTFVAKGTPRVCMSMEVCRAMRRAIEVLTRKVDNMSMTLKSCREHYLKELTYLRNCKETSEHSVAWFSPHVYEDNFTKVEIQRRFSAMADQWKDEREEKNREIMMLRERLKNAGNDDTSHVNRVKSALRTLPLDQVFFCLKQSVEDDPSREASFYSHIERLLAERQDPSESPSKKGLSEKESEGTQQDYIQHIHDLSAQLGDAQARIADLEAEVAWDKRQSDSLSPVKPSRPLSARSRRLQAHRSVAPGHTSTGQDWKAVVASLESENMKLRSQVEELEQKLRDAEKDAEKELDYKRELLRAKEHDYQHLSQELNNVRRQLQSLKSESKKAASKPSRTTGKKPKNNRTQSGGLRPPDDESWATTSRDSLMSGTSDQSSLISVVDAGESMTRVSSVGSRSSDKKSRTTQARLERATTSPAKVENIRSSHSSKRSSDTKGPYSSSEDNTGRDSHMPSGFALAASQSLTRSPRTKFFQAVTTVITCLRVLEALFPRWTAAHKKRLKDEERYTWTAKGIEWARTTSSFVMLPEKGSILTQSHQDLSRGMGRSLWASLLAGHITKADTSDVADVKDGTREDGTEFIWTPKGIEWAVSSGSLVLIPENASKVTEEQLGPMQEAGGCTAGCLAQVCTGVNSAFVWTAEGIRWARASRAFQSHPEPGTPVGDIELQLIRALGGCPHGCLSLLDSLEHAQATIETSQKSEAGTAYRWTAAGVEWARASQCLTLKDAVKDTMVTEEEFRSIRALGGAPSGCITSRGRKKLNAESRGSSDSELEDWRFDPERVPSSMLAPHEIMKDNAAASRRESCPIDLVFGELGELGDVPEEEEMHRAGTAESIRSSLSRGFRKPSVDVAAQTIITFDLKAPTWSCLMDLDHGHQQEGVLNGTLCPGALANGECIESFGEVDEEKSLLCTPESNSIKWSRSLSSDFTVETRIKVLDAGLDALAFGFYSGQKLDMVKIDGNGRAISLEGNNWGYIDDGRSTPLRLQKWATLKFERIGGEMTLEIDGALVLQNIPMKWHVDAVEWQPQQNTMGIAYLKAWPASGFQQDRSIQEALLQKVQHELLQWCQNYLHANRRSLEWNRDGVRPLSARSIGSDRSLGSAGSNVGGRKLSGQMRFLDNGDNSRRKLSQSRRCSLEEHTVSCCEEDKFRSEEEVPEALERRLSQKSDAKQLRSLIDSRFSSLHGVGTSVQTNWSTSRPRTSDAGEWRAITAQGGISGRNAASILNSLSHKRRSSALADEHGDDEVHMALSGSYVSRLPR